MASSRLVAALHFGSTTHAAAAAAVAARGSIEVSSSRTSLLHRRFAHTAAASSDDSTSSDAVASTSRAASTASRQRRAPPVEDLRFPTAPYGPYEIFHLSRKATSSEIKARYYDLVRLMHPDTSAAQASTRSGRAAQAKQAREWEEMQQAYEILSKPASRRQFDMYGIGWSGGGGVGGSAYGAPSQYGWGDESMGPGRGMDFRYRPRNRTARDARDFSGWQTYAQQNPGSFYGYRPTQPADADAGKPRYTSNARFIGALAVLTWIIGAAQYERLSAQSARVVKRADENHLSAAKSLDAAREEARSSEGRKRMENMRMRARLLREESERLAMPQASVPLLEAPR